MSRASWALLAVFLAISALGAESEHERLKIKNDFKRPEDVVRYYCARDASGFVWSGLLEIERRNFTLWKATPQADSFYIAKKYEIAPARISASQPNEASVEVSYDLAGVGDQGGMRHPASLTPMKILFELRKVDGAWKILKPEANAIAPVVVESKFPFSNE